MEVIVTKVQYVDLQRRHLTIVGVESLNGFHV